MDFEKIDKKMFEYLGHLYYGHVDYKDLPWEEYVTRPDSDWQFPIEQLEYWKKVFLKNIDIIANKTVLDIGCWYGNKVPWFDKLLPTSVTCIDPGTYNGSDYMYICEYAASLVKTPTTCVTTKAEDYPLVAHTITMLGVNHNFDDELAVYDKLQCKYFILDTWTDEKYATAPGKQSKRLAGSTHYAQARDFLYIKFTLENEDTYFTPNRVILRYKNKD